MRRRNFIAHLGIGMASCATPKRMIINSADSSSSNILSPDHPKAIAMWDFSWLLRHYKNGGFENWDKALDELQERGYNALRIECFPQFIANDDNGQQEEVYFLPKNGWRPSLWANEISLEINPRQSLIQFLKKCEERKIAIALSSWFYGHGTSRNVKFTGTTGLIRAWDQTLTFLSEHELLKNIIYVDLLNEYPLWHGYKWLKDQLNAIKTPANGPFDFLNERNQKLYNREQIQYYNQFINEVIPALKIKWPFLKFMASQTNTLNTPWQDLDVTNFEVLDIHNWMIYNQPFSLSTNYFQNIHILKNDLHFKSTNKAINEFWHTNKNKLSNWLEQSIIERSQKATKLNLPYGNTEGWGAVMWMEHPHLDWKFIKESGIVAARHGATHGYSFNCSSNFTHPQFTGIWNDLAWHREVTGIIKKTS